MKERICGPVLREDKGNIKWCSGWEHSDVTVLCGGEYEHVQDSALWDSVKVIYHCTTLQYHYTTLQ